MLRTSQMEASSNPHPPPPTYPGRLMPLPAGGREFDHPNLGEFDR